MASDPEHDPRAHDHPPAAQRFADDDTRFGLGRIAAFQYVTVGIFLFLLSGFWVLQVREGETKSELAERNRVKTVPVVAPRGRQAVRLAAQVRARDDQTGIDPGGAGVRRIASRLRYLP